MEITMQDIESMPVVIKYVGETGQTLRAWLGPNNVARIRELLQDY